MKKEHQKDRFWELDVLRGIAILLMIIYHIIFDANWFHLYTIQLYSNPYLLFAYSVRVVFLLLVGVSLSISYSIAQQKLSQQELRIKFLFRGIKIFSLGLLVTAATWIYLKEGAIVFGVLHCIGLSIIFSYPFLRYKLLNFATGTAIILIGMNISKIQVSFPWLLWLGIRPTHFYTLDYFPILPWLGIVLLGVYIGNTSYTEGKRQYHLPNFSTKKSVQITSFFGRHSLFIYLIHQPIIIGLILFFNH